MRSPTRRAAALVLACALGPGCGSLFARVLDGTGAHPLVAEPYAGPVVDFWACIILIEGEPPLSWFLLPLPALDLPLSALLDTLCLPYDLWPESEGTPPPPPPEAPREASAIARMPDPLSRRTLFRGDAAIRSFALDSGVLYTASSEGVVATPLTGGPGGWRRPEIARAGTVVVSRYEALAGVALERGDVELLDLATGAPRATVLESERTSALAFTGVGWLTTGDAIGRVRILPLGPGAPVPLVQHAAAITAVAFEPREGVVVSLAGDGIAITSIDRRTTRWIRSPERPLCLALLGRGELAWCDGRALHVADLATGAELARHALRLPATCVAAEGRTIAVGAGGVVQFFQHETRSRLVSQGQLALAEPEDVRGLALEAREAGLVLHALQGSCVDAFSSSGPR